MASKCPKCQDFGLIFSPEPLPLGLRFTIPICDCLAGQEVLADFRRMKEPRLTLWERLLQDDTQIELP